VRCDHTPRARLGAALVAGLLLGISVTAASPADASPLFTEAASSQTGPCPGTQIEPTRYATRRGKRVGALRVYYDASTGKNCARMDHTRRTWGEPLMTFVYLRICWRSHQPGGPCYGGTKGVVDAGMFEYYAGPVITKRSARGRCIYARGQIVVSGDPRSVEMDPPVGHCGR
jgi:hypothetical protein